MKVFILLVAVVVLLASDSVALKCSSNFGKCDKSRGHCWQTGADTSFCSCKAGFRFRIPATRRGLCVDVNECTSKLDICDRTNGRCVNRIGSYRCVCKRGHTLDYTGTKCLKTSKISGTCWQKRSRRTKHDARKAFLDILTEDTEKKRKSKKRCTCEPGLMRSSRCALCRDINECALGKSLCDLKRGSCHNSNGGYYCSCRTGHVLGPCGYKCYKPSKVPNECTYATLTKHHLISSDADGLSNEATKSQILNFITEKRVVSNKKMLPIQTFLHKSCSKKGATRTQKLDLNNDKKIDITIKYVCKQEGGGRRYAVQSVSDLEAYWTDWTCWTECKATCSGGIQTRTRICKNGVLGAGKCKGPATKFKQCYKGKKCAKRVRREARTLTTTQQKDLVQAMEKYQKDTSTAGFHNAASTHIWPNQCLDGKGKHSGCCYHGAKLNFAMWHRAEMLHFEAGLARHLKDKTIGLPYWDWLKYNNPPDLVWKKKIFGRKNPFAQGIVRIDLTSQNATTRSPKVDPGGVKFAQQSYKTAESLMDPSSIHQFSEALEESHNVIHGSICWGKEANAEKCTYSMGTLAYAGFDPIFFIHHTNTDRLFSVFGQKMKKKKHLAWSRQSVLEGQENIYRFNQPYKPFNNMTLTPFKELHRVNSIEDLFYQEELLGVTYDTLSVRGSEKTKDFNTEKAHIPTKDNQVFLGLFERSIRNNIKIRYFYSGKLKGDSNLGRCNRLSSSHHRFLGELEILGSLFERPWRSRNPTLLNINERMFTGNKKLKNLLSRNKITPGSNFAVKACYTRQLSCTSNCREAPRRITRKIPSHQLLFYPKNIGVDVFKFEWSRGKSFPTWEIDLNSGKQWVQFWGNEASNIVQVNSFRKFRSCNARGGLKVSCGTACTLPRGSHFFIHKNRKKCRSGMRLRIAAAI